MQRGAVSRPEKCPPPATSCQLRYLIQADSQRAPDAECGAARRSPGCACHHFQSWLQRGAPLVWPSVMPSDNAGSVRFAAHRCRLAPTRSAALQEPLELCDINSMPAGSPSSEQPIAGVSAIVRKCLSAAHCQRSRPCYTPQGIRCRPGVRRSLKKSG